VFEADIKACFDEIDHTALMGRVRDRIGDKRVLGWVKAFLNAGVLTEEGRNRETITGTPQGGILSPLLANIALSVLDEHFAAKWAALGPAWTRAKRRRAGEPVMRLVRYADDFVVMVHGTRDDAEALWGEVAAVLAPMGLRLSEEKTRVTTWTRGSTSWAGTSSAEPGEAEQASERSTPTRRRRACSR
jgi:RNA-directed DNA polymerase